MKKNKKVYVVLRKTIVDCAGYDVQDENASGVVCVMNTREKADAFVKGIMTGMSLTTPQRTFHSEPTTKQDNEFVYVQNEKTYPKIKFVCVSDVLL